MGSKIAAVIASGPCVETKQSSGTQSISTVKQYLDSQESYQRVEQMHGLCEQMRQLIAENFSLADVTPKLGDEMDYFRHRRASRLTKK